MPEGQAVTFSKCLALLYPSLLLLLLLCASLSFCFVLFHCYWRTWEKFPQNTRVNAVMLKLECLRWSKLKWPIHILSALRTERISALRDHGSCKLINMSPRSSHFVSSSLYKKGCLCPVRSWFVLWPTPFPALGVRCLRTESPFRFVPSLYEVCSIAQAS